MYAKRTTKYGNRVEAYKYHTYRLNGTGMKRNKRKKPTPEEVKSWNQGKAKRKMIMLMIENFPSGWLLTTTYRKELRPKSVEEATKHRREFFTKLRNWYKKQGKALKYMGRMEVNPMHFHAVINDCPDILRKLREFWPYGNINLTPLYENRDYEGLLRYWFKQTEEGNAAQVEDYPFKQLYFTSRNLVKPESKVEQVKANGWREEPKVPKELREQGYVIEKVENGEDCFGYQWQRVTFINYDQDREKRKKRRIA